MHCNPGIQARNGPERSSTQERSCSSQSSTRASCRPRKTPPPACCRRESSTFVVQLDGGGDTGFARTDHLGFRVFDWLSLYADARSVADNRVIVARRRFGARPNAPRTLIAGLKLTY